MGDNVRRMTPSSESDPLVERLEARLRGVAMVVAARVMRSWSDASELSVEEAGLLLTLASRSDPLSARELADLTGIAIDEAYPVLHHLTARHELVEKHRRYSLTDTGRESVATLEAAARSGVAAFLSGLDPQERDRLAAALGGDGGE
jgi:DNA-binding MarR family transcriptional regulator